MKLIFGLGNPGKEYLHTYHSIGFFSLDHFLQSFEIKAEKKKFSSFYGSGQVLGEKRTFVKPQTFMNRSGIAVVPFIRSLNVSLDEVVVIHDDVDIEEGKIRIKFGGGDGGHKGIRSIIDELGGESDFYRIRIGIGRPPFNMDVADYVLTRIPKSRLSEIAKSGSEALEVLLEKGYQKACNLINRD